MTASGILAATPWLAIPLMLMVLAACCAALFARSLLVACLCLVAAGAAGTAILLLNASKAAPEFALLGVAWAPILLIGATLLSKRAAKTRERRPWLSFVSGAGAAATLTWAVLADAPVAAKVQFDQSASALWLAPLFLVLGVAAMALAGFGERGALEHPEEPH